MRKQLFLLALCMLTLTFVGCNDPKDEPDNAVNSKIDCSLPKNVEAVDLGLPSGIKWANMNVGATISRSYGAYFAWGETKPKDEYKWTNYQLCQGSSSTLTKYCKDSSTGDVDNKTTLDLEDDAAHVNWGGNWRMPTKEEQDELRANCNWSWTDNYNGCGVQGYVVSSKTNSNSIFLPAAGSFNESSIYGEGSHGYYWSSSLYMYESYYVYELDINSSGVDYYRNYRYYGQSIRAVCE